MNFLERLNGSINSLKGNKIRSFLTMLGIIIGIASVITMSAIGKGGQKNITGKLKEGGYGKFVLTIDDGDENFRWKNLFDDSLIEKLKKTKEFKNISPKIEEHFFTKIKGKLEGFKFSISTEEYEDIDKVNIIYGRNFLPFEYEKGERVITLDSITATNLYGNPKDALGETIEIFQKRNSSSLPYEIIGVFENVFEEYAKIVGGRRVPRFARIPLETYGKVYDVNSSGYTDLIVEGYDPENMGEDMKKAKVLLEEITKTKDLYDVNSLTEKASSFDKILSMLNIFITFVAGISLFVAGIGVMNIMLVSVIERTKEIGIRKAIGAKNKDILIQFLIEAVILTGIGGILGIVLGVILAFVIGNLVKISPIYSVTSILISLGVSTMIGIIFGVMPAKKASELNPIEALRSE